jgi:hypothetical protein
LDLTKSTESFTLTYSCTTPLPANGETLIGPAATSEPFLFYRAVSVP